MCDFSELTKLVQESQAKLLRYAQKFLHSAEASQDVVQSAYLKYIRKVQLHESIENPSAWIFRATRNICLDVLKSSYEKSKTVFEESEHDFQTFESPLEEAEKTDFLEMARNAIESLPAREREVVSLKFEEGLSYKEISLVTGLTVNHVGNILYRAVGKIRTVCAENKSTSARRQK